MTNLSRILLPALLLLPAAGELPAAKKPAHGLDRLYQAAARRDAGADIRADKTLAEARAHTVAAPSPVRTVMRVRTVPGGHEVVCTTEHVVAGQAGIGSETPLVGGGSVER